MKKKIAIVFCRMIVGGAEKALVNLLNAIDLERYQVTLFTYDENSAYLDEIPKEVIVRFTKSDEKLRWCHNVANGIYCRLMMRVCRDPYKKFSYSIRCLPAFEEKYHCVISYKLNYEDTATAIWRIKGDKKMVIAHSSVESPEDKNSGYIRIAAKYVDRIYSVSEGLAKSVAAMCGTEKSKVLHNIVPVGEILQKADAGMDNQMRMPALVTVGRLSPEKGQAMVPQAVRILLDKGYDIYWYLVGDGPLREEVERECRKWDVAHRVILLGTKENPYPYIKNCDIYVQPSFSEGYCTTTVEAKILRKPIVTTDAPGMREQFVSGENGLIVEAMTPEALAEGIAALLDYPELRERFVDNLKKETFDNSKELQKLYDFIED